MRTYVRTHAATVSRSSRPPRALETKDLAAVRAAARALPNVVTLLDAVAVLVLMLDSDDPLFEAAAVRWLSRFARQCDGVTLGEMHAALEALDALPAPDAHATLTALCVAMACAEPVMA